MPYIGVSPQFGVRRKHTYTATAGQTSFSGAGSEGATLSYTDSNFVDVYQNGVKLGDADYTSTSGTAIVLVQGASVDDLVEIIVFDAFSAADTVSKADGGTFDGNITMAGTLDVSGAFTSQGIDDNADATAITIDSSERVGVGDTAPLQPLHVKNSTFAYIRAETSASTKTGIDFGQHQDGSGHINLRDSGAIKISTGDTERMRIHSSGFLRASPDSTVTNSRLSATTAHVFHSHTDGSIMFFLENTQADPYGMMFDFSQASPDDNTNFFMKFEDSTAERAHIYTDGDMRNHDGTFSQYSDIRIKQNITDANSQWDDIKAIRFINYKAKDDVRQYGEDKAKIQLGVIAQEMEKISPKLIKEYSPSKADVKSSSEFGTLYEEGDDIPDDKTVGDVKEVKDKVKGIAYSILYMKAVKALQEAMTRIETLEAEVKALKGE